MKLISSLFLSLLFSSFVFAEPVNINTASADEISSALSGIGIKKAQAVVAYREANGSFKSADELTLVKGVGEKTVEKNRADILLKGKTK